MADLTVRVDENCLATSARRHLFYLGALATLAACGGSGDSPAPAPPAAGPDVVTSIAAERSSPWPNQENTYTVTVRSSGTVAASGATLTVPSVAGLTYETATCGGSGGAVCPTTTVPALAGGVALPVVPVGGILTFRLDGVTTGAAGSASSIAATVALSGDLTPGNNTAQLAIVMTAPPAGTLVTSVPAPTYAVGSESEQAFHWINGERARCGMGLMKQDERLDRASLDHSTYLAANIDNGNLSSITHEQNPAFPGYTGLDGTARAQFRAYPGVASDLIVSSGTALDGYQALFGYGVYHALAAQTGNKDIGLGDMRSERWNSKISVLNVAIPVVPANPQESLDSGQRPAGDTVVSYPCGGEALISRSHLPEFPSPFPDVPDLTTKGPPITVFVRPRQLLQIREFTVTTAAGVAIEGTLLTAENRPGFIVASQAAFVPNARLPANTTFNVLIKGTNEGQRFEKRFSYSTGA